MRETKLPNKWHRILIIEFNCFWMSRPEVRPDGLTSKERNANQLGLDDSSCQVINNEVKSPRCAAPGALLWGGFAFRVRKV